MPRQVDCRRFSLQSSLAYARHNPFAGLRKPPGQFQAVLPIDPSAEPRPQNRIELLADALKSGRAPYRSQV
jgi:hypothetical protein